MQAQAPPKPVTEKKKPHQSVIVKPKQIEAKRKPSIPKFSASKSPSRLLPPPSSLSTRRLDNLKMRDYSPLSKKLSRKVVVPPLEIPMATARSTKTLKPITNPIKMSPGRPSPTAVLAKKRLSVEKKSSQLSPRLTLSNNLKADLGKILPPRYMSPTMGHLKRFQRTRTNLLLGANTDLAGVKRTSSPHNFKGSSTLLPRKQAWVPNSKQASNIYSSSLISYTSKKNDNKEPRQASPQLFSRLYQEAERKKKLQNDWNEKKKKKEIDSCTFQPNSHKLKNSYRIPVYQAEESEVFDVSTSKVAVRATSKTPLPGTIKGGLQSQLKAATSDLPDDNEQKNEQDDDMEFVNVDEVNENPEEKDAASAEPKEALNHKRSISVHDKLHKEAKDLADVRKKRYEEAREWRELQECTFKPKINKKVPVTSTIV